MDITFFVLGHDILFFVLSIHLRFGLPSRKVFVCVCTEQKSVLKGHFSLKTCECFGKKFSLSHDDNNFGIKLGFLKYL